MNIEDVFRAVFWTLLVSMFLMRFWFGFRVWRTGERIRAERGALQREGLWAHVVEYLFFLLLAALVPLLWFQGGSLRNFAFPAPGWLRWAGFGLGMASVALFAWTHAVLGRFWSPLLETSPWSPVDCRRSLRTNPPPDVFGDCGVDDQSWSSGGQLDYFCFRDALRAEFHVADSRGRKNDVTTVR